MKRILTIVAFAALAAGCNSNANENAKIDDSIRVAKEQAKLDSFERAEQTERAVENALAKERAATQNNQNLSTATPAPNSTEAEKKGWSSAAKGAVIGGVVGAGTGVLIDKKDARGAVIGGAVGAGTGYVIGREKDKKSGRVQKSN
jgi:hypothetical protein